MFTQIKHIFKYSFLLICIFILATNRIKAQDIAVKANFDSLAILIGDQIKLNLEVEQPRNIKIQFPLLHDSIAGKIELLSVNPMDTIPLADGRIRVSQHYVVTCFDSGYYKIAPFEFIFNNGNTLDTIRNQPIALAVQTLQIKDPKKIADIKSIIDIPLTLAELIPYIAIGAGIILLIALLIYIGIRIKQKKPIFGLLEKPKEPAHVIAFRELDNIKAEKLWQQGLYKQYHSKVADTIRTYIESRFQVPALESTTDEIIHSLEGNPLVNDAMLEKLRIMLSLADLVKFAKAEPLPQENDEVWQISYNFVSDTFKDPVPEEEEVNETDEI